MQEGDRVWVVVPGRRAEGTVERVGLLAAAVSVEGDGVWLVARDRLHRDYLAPLAVTRDGSRAA